MVFPKALENRLFLLKTIFSLKQQNATNPIKKVQLPRALKENVSQERFECDRIKA